MRKKNTNMLLYIKECYDFIRYLLASAENKCVGVDNINCHFILQLHILTFSVTRKIAAFSSSCGELQPSAAIVGPFRPNNRTLRAHLKMLKINLENFAEICLDFLWKSIWKIFGNLFRKFCGNPVGKF